MKNIYSPYQVVKMGIIGRVYNKVDIIIINEKIQKLLNLKVSFDDLERETKISNMLKLYYKNREFIILQLNQQMLESA